MVFKDKLVAPIDVSNWTVSNLPDGVSIGSIVRINDTVAKITLAGNSSLSEATTHIKNVTVTIKQGDLVNSNSSLSQGFGVLLNLSAFLIPARIEAENFHEMSGSEIRVAQDATNGTKLGGGNTGAYSEYNLVIPDSTLYSIEMRVATASNAAEYSLMLDGEELIRTKVPNTGGWETWKTISHEIELPAGEHTFKLYIHKGWFGLNWFNFIDLSTVGLENRTDYRVGIYPNPVKDILHIENNKPGTVSIIDMKGNEVYKNIKVTSHQIIDLSTLTQGIYQLIFLDENKLNAYTKFVKE